MAFYTPQFNLYRSLASFLAGSKVWGIHWGQTRDSGLRLSQLRASIAIDADPGGSRFGVGSCQL